MRSRASRAAGLADAEPKGGTGETELTATTGEELAAPEEEAVAEAA